MKIDDIYKTLNPDIYERFKLAIEIGKWPDGRTLTPQQKAICLQAIIVYEHKFLEKEQRSGYVPPKNTSCSTAEEQDTVKWR